METPIALYLLLPKIIIKPYCLFIRFCLEEPGLTLLFFNIHVMSIQ